MLWGDVDKRLRINVECGGCGWKGRLVSRIGDPGHEPGASFVMICPGCEDYLWVRVPWTVGVEARA